MAVSAIDVPDISVGDPGEHWQGTSILLWVWKANFEKAQAVCFLHCASVDAHCLMLLQLFDGDHMTGIVFAAGHLFGFLGVLFPA